MKISRVIKWMFRMLMARPDSIRGLLGNPIVGWFTPVRPGRPLDLGCGMGMYSSFLVQRSDQMIAFVGEFRKPKTVPKEG